MFKLELKTILSSICQLNSLLHQQTVTVTMKACPPDAVMRCISIFVAMVPWKSWKLLELSSYFWLLIWSVSKSTKLFYLVSYGGIMKGWKWKCESTQLNAIFLPRELARTPVHCCKTSNIKTTVQIKTADNLQSQCDVNSNLQDHFQLNARLPSPLNSLQNLPPWLWPGCI